MTVSRTSLIATLLLCLILRLSLFIAFKPWDVQVESKVVLQGDALGYHELATTLLETGRFAYDANSGPDGLRTPLYPLFVATVYYIFVHKMCVVFLVQMILDTISCFLLMVAIDRLFGRRSALSASVLYACDPFLISYCSALLSDILFVFVLVCWFYLFSITYQAASQKKALRFYGLCGALLGVATLVRPISIYIPPFLVFFFIIAYWKDWLLITKALTLFVISFCLIISPWFIRNYTTFATLSLSTIGSRNLLILYAVPMEMNRLGKDEESVMQVLLQEVDRAIINDGGELHTIDQFKLAEYYKSIAIKTIKEHPIQFIKAYLKGIAFNFLNLDTSRFGEILRLPMQQLDMRAYNGAGDLITEFFEKKGVLGLIIGGVISVYLFVTYSLTMIGIAVSWKHYESRLLFYILLMAGYFILITGAGGICRLKLPSVPFYLCFAGIGFNVFYEKVLTQKFVIVHQGASSDK